MKKSIVITSLFLILTAVSCGSNNYGGMRRNAIKAGTEDNYEIQIVDELGWKNISYYLWDDAGPDNGWPGQDMFDCRVGRNSNDKYVYSLSIPKNYDKITFTQKDSPSSTSASAQTWDYDISWLAAEGENSCYLWGYEEWKDKASISKGSITIDNEEVTLHFDLSKWYSGDEDYGLFICDNSDHGEFLALNKVGRYASITLSAEKTKKYNKYLLIRVNKGDEFNWDNMIDQTNDMWLPRSGEHYYLAKTEDVYHWTEEVSLKDLAKTMLFDYSGSDLKYSKTTNLDVPDSIASEYLHCNATPFRVTEYDGASLYMHDLEKADTHINSGYMDYDGSMWHFYMKDEEVVRDWKVEGESIYTYYYSMYNFIGDNDALDLAKWTFNNGAFEYAVTDLSLDENNKYNDKVLQAFQYFALPMVLDTAGSALGITKLTISELIVGEASTLQFHIWQGSSSISTSTIVRG